MIPSMALVQRIAVICGVALLSFLAVNPALARIWTDGTGKFRIDAEFVSLADGVVTLRKPDGSSTDIPLEKLSKADQDFVQDSIKRTVPRIAEPTPKPSKTASGPDSLKGTKDVQVVVADGAGATPDEALKDAFRNAVRQVVGAVVDAETLVKNDEVIVDKVLTYSNGFIEMYDDVPNSKKNQGGIHRITIKAVVKKGNVVTKLRAASVAVNELDGKGLFAEITTKLDEEKNAEALLRKALEGFPANCIVAEVAGKPEVLKKDEEKATIKVMVRFSPSPEGCKAFGKCLESILDKLARKKGQFVLSFERQNDSEGNFQMYSLLAKDGTKNVFFGSVPEVYDARSLLPIAGRLAVALNTRASKVNDRLEYRYYVVDEALRTVLSEPASLQPDCRITFVGGDGEAIATDRFNPGEREPGGGGAGGFGGSGGDGSPPWPVSLYAANDHNLGKPPGLFIASTVFGVFDVTHIRQKPVVEISRQIQISLDDLKKISKVECELRFTK